MKKLCKAEATTPYDGKPGRCKRVAKCGDYCWQHDPERVPTPRGEAKEDETPRKTYLKAAQRALLLEDCYVAVKRIAAGHGDPMILCKQVLERFK